ncbi:hypothetical protein, partial [Campylobacter concisus]|uniref:hypothetical protein n=1 Tax=Campylobacter concisus TaxID=199 RepID=UPI001CB711C6
LKLSRFLKLLLVIITPNLVAVAIYICINLSSTTIFANFKSQISQVSRAENIKFTFLKSQKEISWN